MFVVLLTFSENRGQAGPLMDGHNAWIKQGVEDGVFLLVGKLQPDRGGAILAHGEDLENLHSRIAQDPFVQEGVVTPEILEISPARADDRLQFLLD